MGTQYFQVTYALRMSLVTHGIRFHAEVGTFKGILGTTIKY